MKTIDVIIQRSNPTVSSILVPYPQNFPEDEKSQPENLGFYVSYTPVQITSVEFDLAQEYFKKKYPKQKLRKTGTVMIGDDELLTASHEDLDRYEQSQNLPSTRKAPGGGFRSIQSRVLLIREYENK